MSTSTCRLCNSQNTKLTASIHDELLSNFLALIPSINLASNAKFSSLVCQLCFGKAKISSDFIAQIQKVQKDIQKNFKKSPKKFSGSSSTAAEEALKKVQRVSGIVVKRVTNTFEQPEEDPEEIKIEVDFDDDDKDQDYKVESEYEIEVEDSDGDYIEEVVEDDDDDDYKPSPKKAKEGGVKGKQKKARVTKDVSKNEDSSHEILIDAPISFTCSKCSAKYPDLETLTAHMRTRTCFPVEVPTCKECGKTFNSKKNLYSHMRTHQQRDKVICELCAKAFNHTYDLNSHMESVHRRVVRRDCIYKCTHCQANFDSQMDLMDHVKEHLREKKEAPRMCEFCGRECKNQKAYQNHLLTHKETKPHNCTECGKGFMKHFLLVQHMHIHTGIKAYSCDICDKSYAKRDSLRIHKKRDHPEYILST